MSFFTKEPTIKFMKVRGYAFGLSGLVIALGILFYFINGFNLGIDFTGGTMIEVSFKEHKETNEVRSVLNKVDLGGAEIQKVGTNENKFFIKTSLSHQAKAEKTDLVTVVGEVAGKIKGAFQTDDEKQQLASGKFDMNDNLTSQYYIKKFLLSKGIAETEAEDGSQKISELKKTSPSGLISGLPELEKLDLKKRVLSEVSQACFFGHFTFLSVESVGPQVGHDLQMKATLATVWALIGMLVYIAFRFKFIFGLSGILTLFHDVLVALSFIIIFRIEMNLTVVAALLTIVGYSINDTIVIFDRLRDNMKILRKDSVEALLDKSINQTLSRTVITSGTVLLTVLALFFFGGANLYPFAFTMLVGVIAGSYSTIYQSCGWLLIWKKYLFKTKKAEILLNSMRI